MGKIRAFMQSTNLLKKASLMALKAFAPTDKRRTRKVPPDFLAVANWREVALNVRYFHRSLARDEQALEWKRHNLLSRSTKNALQQRI